MNSKRKGSKWERQVAKFFTEWTGYEFGRTPQSGAYHRNQDLGSDLICNDEKHAHRCKISIECKSYRDIRFEHILLGNKRCDILEFWEQASRDARRTKKIPILCMRYNSMPKGQFFFVVDSGMYKGVIGAISCTHLNITINDGNTGMVLMVFMSNDIKNNVDYKLFHKEAKRLLK